MDLLDCRTDIHLGVAPHLGKVGVQCTAAHLYVYRYNWVDQTNKLIKVNWDQVVEIRIDSNNQELKFTFSNNIKLMPGNGPLKIGLKNARTLVEQMNQQFGSGMVKVYKFKSNLTGCQYYKPASKVIRNQIPDSGPIFEEDFQEHFEIAKIAQEFPFGVSLQSKHTASNKVVSFFGYFF